MKKISMAILSFILVSSILCLNVFAMPFNPDSYTSVNKVSELLPDSVKSDRAHEMALRRGDFFAAADLIITNKGNGDIGVLAKAYMEYSVDEVYITIYLDRWDATAERWRQVSYYDAEFYAKDYPDGLNDPEVSITFKNQPKGYYYRARGVFAAQFDGKFEGFSPVTDGVLVD